MPESLSPKRLFGLLVSDFARLARKRFEQIARKRRLGLTRAQAAVILHLAGNEGINQVSLAQIMELEPITLVRLLDKLQAAGLIERRPDATDRRARILFLTPAARPLLARIESLAEEVREEAMAGLGAAERIALVDMLVTMKINLLEQLASQPDEIIGGRVEDVTHG